MTGVFRANITRVIWPRMGAELAGRLAGDCVICKHGEQIRFWKLRGTVEHRVRRNVGRGRRVFYWIKVVSAPYPSPRTHP